jgi:predicted DCC family thiol-disulfide oxidoreductase YuxK
VSLRPPVVVNVVQNTSGNSLTENGGTPPARPRPLLIYDGDCGFCVYSVRYWQKLTRDAVEYRPYQDAAAQFPDISQAEFQRAIQYIAPDGDRASAAEASFLTLSHARGRGIGLALYRHLPGFAPVSEWAYAFIAAHREAFYNISKLLWGKAPEPPRYDLVSFLFLRLLGLIYLSAFVSFAVQAQGLIGSHGILPLKDFVDAVAASYGPERFYLLPMVFWLNDSDTAIQVVCWAGAAFSLLLTVNVLPRLSLFLLYVLYLSVLYAGQTFTSYQWDTYLLEMGFAALLLSFVPAPGIWLLRWLMFRFMFMSGVVKLMSGDPNWWNLSALSYHFFTQPLPTPLAWYAAQMPAALLTFATGAVFFIELVLPFFIFGPRRLRFIAAFGFLLLQGFILVTGNYNWFNLQTMVLCLPLFDDAALRNIVPSRLARLQPVPHTPRRAVKIAVSAIAVFAVFCSLVQMGARFGRQPPAWSMDVAGLADPFHITSPYGLFAIMTTKRHEIVIQGSNDNVEWRDYEFRYKPGDVSRRPPWNIPHQPRLDWQMWFAALDDPKRLTWFSHFIERLLQNEPTVTALLKHDPFPDKPPKYVRAQFYDYTFPSGAEHSQGLWWDRTLIGEYFPSVYLTGRAGGN